MVKEGVINHSQYTQRPMEKGGDRTKFCLTTGRRKRSEGDSKGTWGKKTRRE